MRSHRRNCRVCPMRMDRPNHWALRYLFLHASGTPSRAIQPNRACDKTSAVARVVLISATNMVARSVSGRVHIPASLPHRSPSVSHLGSIAINAPPNEVICLIRYCMSLRRNVLSRHSRATCAHVNVFCELILQVPPSCIRRSIDRFRPLYDGSQSPGRFTHPRRTRH